jgi:hypothetical protein
MLPVFIPVSQDPALLPLPWSYWLKTRTMTGSFLRAACASRLRTA